MLIFRGPESIVNFVLTTIHNDPKSLGFSFEEGLRTGLLEWTYEN